MAKSKSKSKKKSAAPELVPVEEDPSDSEHSGSDSDNDGESEDKSDDGSDSVYDSADEGGDYGQHFLGQDDDDEFEDQGSSDEDEELTESQLRDADSDSDELELEENIEQSYERAPRKSDWNQEGKRSGDDKKRKSNKDPAVATLGKSKAQVAPDAAAEWFHTDDLSSDDEDEKGAGNRIGRVPLHWYEEFDHIGYDAHGKKVAKSTSAEGSGDRLDQLIARTDMMEKGQYIVHDALNDRNIELTARQLELIRRVQAGAFAHPEFDANPDYIDYYSGIQEISGIHSNRTEPKARFQPSEWEKLQVDRLLEKLKRGDINMDYLTGKVRDMNDVKNKNKDSDKPYLLWKGDEEDLLAMRKGPQHIAPPKLAPPGHAESYRPPGEYLPTEDDIKQWEEMEAKDRPHGRLVPKEFPNLRSVGAYEHAVTETFERCLDLYLCPRVMKRRLNIDPESLVPKLPKASDLRPFPTAKCIEYIIDFDGDEPPLIRCLSPSPDGQFLASGSSDGVVRLWEVQTGRMLRNWDLNQLVEQDKVEGDIDGSEASKTLPVVCLQWNPNRAHHCLIAALGTCIAILSTGTAGDQDAEVTNALLAAALKGGNVTNEKAAKAVQWETVKVASKAGSGISAFDRRMGPVAVLRTNREVSSLRWHSKGDYFVSVSPKAGAAAVLIHQLSKGNSQQPFTKTKGESQLACFHPNKPFLFVSSQQHIRIYHLVNQTMVKRLISGCKWISSMDVHPTGDHLLVGSLDRRLIWFDLDLSSSPFKTLKYHERGLRAVHYHSKYPLMASTSDDGTIHVFHSTVYSDLMKNPMIVPVKILRGHTVFKNLGVLSVAFHPTQPWLFSGGSDGRIFLYQDI